jgi:transglutaminase-like putative cysteine protease
MTHSARALLERPLLDLGAVDLEGATRVVYALRQEFRYDYAAPAFELQHRLMAIPKARHGGSRRLLQQLEVTAPGARTTRRRDAHGNVVAWVRVDTVPDSVAFRVHAVVERTLGHTDPVLPAAALRDPRLLRPTRLTRADDALRTLAAELRAAAADDLELAELCCQRVRAAIGYEYGVTSTTTTAAEAFAGGRGVCQDHAHVMIAVCRAAGVPARYVSGHLLGDGGTHAWVEVVVPDGPVARAVAFDPCNGCRAGVRHLTVATGRDYTDVAPTSGRFRGGGPGALTATKQVGITAAWS